MGGKVVWVPKFPDREMWGRDIGCLGSSVGLGGSGRKKLDRKQSQSSS